MTSIALAVCIVFIVYVMIWSIRNDGVRSIREQTGYIKMRVPEEKTCNDATRARANTPGDKAMQPEAHAQQTSPANCKAVRPGAATRCASPSAPARRPHGRP